MFPMSVLAEIPTAIADWRSTVSMENEVRSTILTCRIGHDKAIKWKRVSAYAIRAAAVAGAIHLARPDREVQSLIVASRIPLWLA